MRHAGHCRRRREGAYFGEQLGGGVAASLRLAQLQLLRLATMPDADPKYVRVYYSVVNDERFSTVYHDARHLGTWLQLLLVADAMYPADAPLPAYVNRASVKVLVDCGLIEARMHQHYRMHGLASEREKRSQSGRNAAAMRWQSERIADPMPRRAETSKDETSKAEQDERPDLDAFLGTRFRLPTPNQRTFMDTYCQVFDQTGPERAARRANQTRRFELIRGDTRRWRRRSRSRRSCAAPRPTHGR